MAAPNDGMKRFFYRLRNMGPIRLLDTSLRARLVTFFAVITIIPVTVVGIVSYSQVWGAIQQSTTSSTQVIAEQLETNIDLVFRDAERFLKIGTHETTMGFLNPLGQSEERTYALSLEIIQLFELFREIYEFDSRIKGIHVLGFNGNHIGELEGRYELSRDLEEIRTVNTALKSPGDVFLVPNSVIDYAGYDAYDDVISVTRTIVRPVTRELMGVIIVDVDRQAITALCESITIGETGHFSIISEEGRIIYPRELSVADIPLAPENIRTIVDGASGYLIDGSGGEDELYVYATLEPWSWKIVGRVKMDEIMKNAYRIRNVTFLAVVLSLVLVTVLYFFFSDAITHPIRDLMTVMRAAESGNLDVRATSKSHDEISDLCRGFNRMLTEIRDLMHRNVKEQEDLKKSELKALQAQINPHFLYNTLDAIVWMAEADHPDDVIRMTKALSSFFRISLSKGKEWITCAEELLHVRRYLDIQKMRHADLLDFTMSEEEAVADLRILKLTLQPIVENAVDHGIKKKRNGGRVRVASERDGDVLTFTVTDDGVGMDPERLERIRRELDVETGIHDPGTGYGLRNVHQRLKLYYGEGWGLRISSTPGEGTAVTVSLPALEMETAGV